MACPATAARCPSGAAGWCRRGRCRSWAPEPRTGFPGRPSARTVPEEAAERIAAGAAGARTAAGAAGRCTRAGTAGTSRRRRARLLGRSRVRLDRRGRRGIRLADRTGVGRRRDGFVRGRRLGVGHGRLDRVRAAARRWTTDDPVGLGRRGHGHRAGRRIRLVHRGRHARRRGRNQSRRRGDDTRHARHRQDRRGRRDGHRPGTELVEEPVGLGGRRGGQVVGLRIDRAERDRLDVVRGRDLLRGLVGVGRLSLGGRGDGGLRLVVRGDVRDRSDGVVGLRLGDGVLGVRGRVEGLDVELGSDHGQDGRCLRGCRPRWRPPRPAARWWRRRGRDRLRLRRGLGLRLGLGRGLAPLRAGLFQADHLGDGGGLAIVVDRRARLDPGGLLAAEQRLEAGDRLLLGVARALEGRVVRGDAEVRLRPGRTVGLERPVAVAVVGVAVREGRHPGDRIEGGHARGKDADAQARGARQAAAFAVVPAVRARVLAARHAEVEGLVERVELLDRLLAVVDAARVREGLVERRLIAQDVVLEAARQHLHLRHPPDFGRGRLEGVASTATLAEGFGEDLGHRASGGDSARRRHAAPRGSESIPQGHGGTPHRWYPGPAPMVRPPNARC